MLRTAVRYIIRSVLVIMLFAGAIVGGFLSIDRYIIKAAGPHDAEKIVLIQSGDGHATIRWTAAACWGDPRALSL